MKRQLLLTLYLLFPLTLMAQLNCKKRSENGQEITTCYHKNGKASTIESWDEAHRNGKVEGYTAGGTQLFSYHLRRYAGHASAHIDYHPNGQVSKVEFSDAPDGGIQYFHETRQYDETGQLTYQWKDEYPDRLLLEPLKEEPLVQPREQQPVTVTCAVPYLTVFRLVNESRKTVTIELRALPNKWVQLSNKSVTLKPGQTLNADSLVLAQHFLEMDEAYQVRLGKGIKGLRILQLAPDSAGQTGPRKVYTWYIQRNR